MNSQTQSSSSNSVLYKASLTFLSVSSWISGVIFALYILGFYIAAHTPETLQAWNKVLPNLYSPEQPAAITGMISHFFFGALLLIMGPIQFSSKIRLHYVNFHRWTGMFYTLSAFITGFGGLVFLLVWGAAGGLPMLIGFSIYGLLMMIYPVQVIRFALLKNFKIHREWAIRLFALVLGSWIYRMSYGVIFTILKGWGLGKSFSGPLDWFMDFAFFVIPLIIAEIIIKGLNGVANSIWRYIGSALCIISGLLIWNATIYFLNKSWGSAIASLFGF